MSSNNICLCIIFFLFFLCIIVLEHLHVNTPLIYHLFWFCFCSIMCWFGGCFLFYVSSVYLTGSVPRWRTKNLTWPVWCTSYFLLLSLSVTLSRLFTVFNVIIDHVYKGSFVISVCIGKRKIMLLRPTQWKYLSVYWLHHIVRWLCF